MGSGAGRENGSDGCGTGGTGRTGAPALEVGLAAKPLATMADALSVALAELDPGQLPARDATDVVRVCDRISRVADAAKALAAGRVAESSLWSRGGHRSPAHWMAKACGVSVGEAARMLDLAETVAAAPGTKEALVAGTLSGRQAGAVGRAEKADPAAGRRLAEKAPGMTLGEVQTEANRIVAAASTEAPEETAARHHRARRIWHSVDAEGMGVGGWRLPIAEHTRFVAGLQAEQAAVFDRARRAGEREPAEAYAADAFCRIIDRAFAVGDRRGGRRGGTADAPTSSTADTTAGSTGETTTGSTAGTTAGSTSDTTAGPAVSSSGGVPIGDVPTSPPVVDDWSFAKVIVKVDLTALDRGAVRPGEVCEVAGQGPIPVGDVWRMIDGDAFVAAVATRGSEISKVVHLGRRPTVLQRTSLEWSSDGGCQIVGCGSRARLEIDHVADWAATRRTELGELAQVCGHHHDLKTHHGYRFGPLRPDGRRQLVQPPGPGADAGAAPPAGRRPPGDTGPPAGAGPPELTLHHDGADGRKRERVSTPEDPTRDPVHRTRRLARGRQGDLFDTG